MNKTRTRIKKFIYKTFGEGVYAKAYAKGKVRDINNGVLDEKEAAFLAHFIQNDSTVLDIGANYGHYAIDMSRICKNGHVFAFEPVPFTHKVLEKIVAHFGSTNITLNHAAVSDKLGTIEMTVPLLDFGAPNTGVAYVGEQTETAGKTVKVKTIAIDELPFSSKIDFIKIDIEGHEPHAFKGMKNLLLKDRPVILIEFSHPCLNRADSKPSEFATYIKNELSYTFTQVANKSLELVQNETPPDGYYFLIPTEGLTGFKNLFTS
ncbi:MAG: FkbM family methyltransferase [Crocinitomix sp.]|jgi:FkbM family methyltransferase